MLKRRQKYKLPVIPSEIYSENNDSQISNNTEYSHPDLKMQVKVLIVSMRQVQTGSFS